MSCARLEYRGPCEMYDDERGSPSDLHPTLAETAGGLQTWLVNETDDVIRVVVEMSWHLAGRDIHSDITIILEAGEAQKIGCTRGPGEWQHKYTIVSCAPWTQESWVLDTERRDTATIGKPLWTLSKDGRTAAALARAIDGVGLELRYEWNNDLRTSQIFKSWDELEQTANAKREELREQGWKE